MAAFDPDAYLAKKKAAFDPDSYLASKKGDTGPSFTEALSGAPRKMLGTAVENTLKAPAFIGNAAVDIGKGLVNDPLGYVPGKIAETVIGAAKGAKDAYLGGMQFYRNQSPDTPEFRGTHPAYEGGEPEKHRYLGVAKGVAQGDPYGGTRQLRQDISDKPWSVLGDALSVAGSTAPGRALIGRGTDLAMRPVNSVVRSIADLTPERRAQVQLLEAANRTPGNTPESVATRLETRRAPAPGVPYSAAHASQDTGITGLELGSRQSPAQVAGWGQFDSRQNTALYRALDSIVSPATDEAVEAARTARDRATRYHRQGALAQADQGGMEGPHLPENVETEAPWMPNQRAGLFEQPIHRAVGQELAGDRGALASVEKTAGYILDPKVTQTAGRVYEARKMLTDAMNAKVGVPLDEIASSAKSAGVSTRIIRDAMDDALDQASGGAWREYLRAFRRESGAVDNITALNGIREDLQRKVRGGSVMDGNGNPKLSRSFIHQTIEKHSRNKYGDLLSRETAARLAAVRRTAREIEAPAANYKGTVTANGGSMTSHNRLIGPDRLAHMLGPPGRFALSVARGIGSMGETGGATRLANLLQNPVDAAGALRRAAEIERRRRLRSTGVRPTALIAGASVQPEE